MTKEEVLKRLEEIEPGVNYPGEVIIREKAEGKELEIQFGLQSYFSGMYCAIRMKGVSTTTQTGDHDNKKFVAGLKKDIKKALARGAEIEISSLRPIKKL